MFARTYIIADKDSKIFGKCKGEEGRLGWERLIGRIGRIGTIGRIGKIGKIGLWYPRLIDPINPINPINPIKRSVPIKRSAPIKRSTPITPIKRSAPINPIKRSAPINPIKRSAPIKRSVTHPPYHPTPNLPLPLCTFRFFYYLCTIVCPRGRGRTHERSR